jgi:hypothetical protein
MCLLDRRDNALKGKSAVAYTTELPGGFQDERPRRSFTLAPTKAAVLARDADLDRQRLVHRAKVLERVAGRRSSFQ